MFLRRRIWQETKTLTDNFTDHKIINTFGPPSGLLLQKDRGGAISNPLRSIQEAKAQKNPIVPAYNEIKQEKCPKQVAITGPYSFKKSVLR